MGLYSDPPTSEQFAEAQRLAVLAYEQPTIGPAQRGAAIVGITVALWPLAFIVVTLRVWVRAWYMRSIKAWGFDDSLSVIGFFLYTAAAVFALIDVHFGMGITEATIRADERIELDALVVRAMEYFTYWEVLVLISTCVIKAAISMALMRITSERKFRIPLWMVTTSSGFVGFGALLSVLVSCRPIQAAWNAHLGQCLPSSLVENLSYALSAIAIPTDFICAIIPYFVVRDLQMSYRTKRALVVVMGLGIVAGVGTVARVPYFKTYTEKDDKLYRISNLMIWTMLENGLGIIAGCLPPLGKLYGIIMSGSGYTDRSVPSKPVIVGGHTIGGTPFTVPSQQELFAPKDKGYSTAFASRGTGKWDRLEDEEMPPHTITAETMVRIESETVDDAHELSLYPGRATK
ncbi:hypothetical protein AB5N19_02541 [Seiridium cardinale]